MKIIINADDFGLTKSVNKAILDLAQAGSLSSTTVMASLPDAIEAKELLKFINVSIGLHFNLTQGRPVSGLSDIPTLVNEDGRFYAVNDLRARIKNQKVNGKDVLTELNSQFSLLESIVGWNISHIDSHQDINKYKLINNTLITFAEQKNLSIGLRWYNKAYLKLTNNTFQIIEPSFFNIARFGLKRFITEKYFQSNRKKLKTSFKLTDGMLYSSNHNMRTLLKQLTMIPSGFSTNMVLEVMVHPATSTDELSETKMLDARIEEYEILKSPEFQEFIQKNKLLSFADLK